MSVDRVEAVVDAISRHFQIHNPESICYKLRNPLMLKSFAKPGKHLTTPEGQRIFTSMLAGYKAATFDVKLKIEGLSRAGLKPDDRLENLLAVYGISGKVPTDNIVAFLRRALEDQNISKTTPLSYFIPKPSIIINSITETE